MLYPAFNVNLTSSPLNAISMMDCDPNEELFTRALDHLRSAIRLLDLAEAPSQIAAHVDLSACQLADLIGVAFAASTLPEQAGVRAA